MADGLKILAYEDTPLGPLCLRRRLTLSEPQVWVTEVTLNHEFLMSSLHTDSERTLATFPLERLSRGNLRVLVGGLGLGFTAAAALESARVAEVEVVEFLPQVIGWLRQGLGPLAEMLSQDARLRITEGDVYERLLAAPGAGRFDAILIDVDHSPTDTLAGGPSEFYTAAGLRQAATHLAGEGMLAMWSYEADRSLMEAMREVFTDVLVHPVRYHNRHVNESFVDWLYVGRVGELPGSG